MLALLGRRHTGNQIECVDLETVYSTELQSELDTITNQELAPEVEVDVMLTTPTSSCIRVEKYV